jgi:hypothetical protein
MNIVAQRKLLSQTIADWDDVSNREFLTRLQASVEYVLEHQLHIPESAFATDQDHEETDDFVITPDERSDGALTFLRYAAACVLTTLETTKHHPLKEQYPIVRLFHDTLDELDASCGPSAVPAVLEIVKLCEKWWLIGGDSSLRETVILNALPHIVRTYQFSRIYAIRHALELVDWNHRRTAEPESDPENQKRFLQLVMSCVSQPKLKNQTNSEGIKFVSYLLSILPEQTHNSIRSQLPDTSRAMAKAYGHIYHRAMNAKDASDNPNDSTSSTTIADFLTDFVYAILHVENNKLYQNLKILLQPFHKEPTFCDTFYGPLLFRNMAAANPKVRARAVQIIEDLHLSRTQLEMTVRKLLDDGLLVDADERVRVAAGSTAAHILQRYWNVLDTTDIRRILNRKYYLKHDKV